MPDSRLIPNPPSPLRTALARALLPLLPLILMSPAAQGADSDFPRCPTPVTATASWQQLSNGQLPAGSVLQFDVDLAQSPGFELSQQADRVTGRYRMGFNQIAEGWNWFPQANPADEDYYHHKFLPLASVDERRSDYAHEDKIGVVQQMQVRWRYDYFLAFENLYAFFPRGGDDDAGFVAQWPATAAPAASPPGSSTGIRLQAQATLLEATGRESSTFWKATYGKPVDFTLKKRYFMARLDALHWCDAASGRLLATTRPGHGSEDAAKTALNR